MSIVAKLSEQAEEAADAQTEGITTARQSTLDRRRTLVRHVQSQGLVGVLLVLIIIFWISSPYFMTVNNWSVIARISAILGILAVTQTLLVLAGEIDISVG